jgi:hypothetical protein
MTRPAEIWKDVPGYEGHYQVSNLGKVKSLPKRTRKSEKILKPSLANTGYHRVNLVDAEGDKKLWMIQYLVLLAFVGPRPKNYECCHGDGVKTNNYLSNLRWDTSVGNKRDNMLHGVDNRGERCGSAKLTREQVLEIRTRLKDKEKEHAVKLAEEYGVSIATIRDVHSRRTWGWLL